ncbi:putative pseudouridine synthase [Diplodia seriata]|uniref:Putative pseudouridine synthase n=1 Tax=Diplodia seriata TaxID=420778 RepID=A0A0G2EMF9_9PEZI|nr:putative pseudouridine synthase [Diplodia seriata]
MALTPVERRNSFLREDIHNTEPETFEEPPAVITTPVGDMWPRPYYLENGLRRVQPYHFTYNTNCKQRWRGRELLEIFTDEFRDRPAEYYKEAIENGTIVVNGKRASSINHILKNGDIISHTMHRHEPPVTAAPIGVVHEDDDIIVINKPAGVPVHPAGRYNFNSVVEILRAQRDYSFNPSPCNRLDRLTSGVMFIGKNRRAADDLSVQIKDRTVKKEYVARVVGEFPDGDVVCEKPILQISPKLGLNRVRANGKEARTVFRRLAYYPPAPREGDDQTAAADEEEKQRQEAEREGKPWKSLRGYSIVRCRPLTGRTHQIRVHLQFLGHPISNDPIYANQRVFGPALAQNDDRSDDDDDIVTRLGRMGKDEVAEAVAYHDEMVDDYNKRKAEKLSGEVCEICNTALYTDPGVHELGIYLHARKYACEAGRWSYETELPAWALPPAGFEGPTEATVESDPLAADLAKLGLNDDGTVTEERRKAEAGEAADGEEQQPAAVAVAAA